MSGAGTTDARGGLALGGSAASTSLDLHLDQRTLINGGDATLAGSPTDGWVAWLFLASGAAWSNGPGTTFAFAGSEARVEPNSGTPAGGSFVNRGTLSKPAAGAAAIDVPYSDTASATLDVTAGTLALGGGGTAASTAGLRVGAGATLEFTGGTFVVAAGSGALRGRRIRPVRGGTVHDAGSYAVAGLTTISRGTLDYAGAAAGTARGP